MHLDHKLADCMRIWASNGEKKLTSALFFFRKRYGRWQQKLLRPVQLRITISKYKDSLRA